MILFLLALFAQSQPFVNYGAVKGAFAGDKRCFFYGAPVAPYSVEVACYGAGYIEQMQVNLPGSRMVGANDDDSITWIINGDRSFHIVVGGVQNDGTF